ncbi:hypothetical protein HA42_09960 [Pantoea deleyi]|uniref:Uncharacterized protein n=1 Tax=Pantoea deleyi TaxID=470932 RepID=A0A506R0Q2_9GAMM|nr:hypothetical protein [Pantoea deleyi]ORM81699.1 hypothetical protein HA42_09960 [Pantoea deleyi]TPV50340.1 hypothetical protein FJW01_00300 [Pantoea deleyi]
MKKMLIALMFLAPVAVQADEDVHSLEAIKKTATEYLEIDNTIEGRTAAVIHTVTVDTAAHEVRFSFTRFTKFNNYATCESVKGHLTYEFLKVDEADKMLVKEIEQQSSACEFRQVPPQ